MINFLKLNQAKGFYTFESDVKNLEFKPYLIRRNPNYKNNDAYYPWYFSGPSGKNQLCFIPNLVRSWYEVDTEMSMAFPASEKFMGNGFLVKFSL